jgi:hypothetical protein
MNKEETTMTLHDNYERRKRKLAEHALTDVCPAWLEEVDLSAIYPQECYYRAYRYATHPARMVEGVYIVHGETSLVFGGHAWVELPDGVAFDGVFQQFYPLDVWDREVHPLRWYKFTPMAADIIVARLRFTHPGMYCWDAALDLPWGDPSKPLIIDYQMAHNLLVAQGR